LAVLDVERNWYTASGTISVRYTRSVRTLAPTSGSDATPVIGQFVSIVCEVDCSTNGDIGYEVWIQGGTAVAFIATAVAIAVGDTTHIGAGGAVAVRHTTRVGTGSAVAARHPAFIVRKHDRHSSDRVAKIQLAG
jgi:hypothetical protein